VRVWHVRKGAEGKVRRGYPWVFSNELAHSPKEAAPGEPIELRDYTDIPIAFGYGHPHSLIAFRTFTHGPQPWAGAEQDFLLNRLQHAAALRRRLGLNTASHRLCFAEADGLPGLIVDRYRLADSSPGAPAQVLAVQISTAGMERAVPDVLRALERLVAGEAGEPGAVSWDQTGVLLDQGSSMRALEELPLLPKVWQRLPPGPWDGSSPALVWIATGLEGGQAPGEEDVGRRLPMAVDFLGGQKTGFFLDHRLNLGLAKELLGALLHSRAAGGPAMRVLDLFCYAGQWGAVLAREAAQQGIGTDVLAVDASERALELAQRNIAAAVPQPKGGQAPQIRVQAERRDILESVEGIPLGAFDVVISDPPALVRRRKDLLKSQRAYQKLNREALKRVRPGGLFVTCSCSGLLPEEDFREILQRAQTQAGRSVQWVARGGQGLDHPVRAEFPEGRYLKCWFGIVED
jgi:23S rRNA (cytosine1962-C5)-methyltransferase